MAKSSGGTRASTKESPRGLVTATAQVISEAESNRENFESVKNVSKYIATQLENAGFSPNQRSYGDSREQFNIANGVEIIASNGRNVRSGVPGAYYTSSAFDRERAHVRILDNLKSNTRLQNIYNALERAGLQEATGGKTAQWGTWKFAIRSDNDLNKVISVVKKYSK